jgi:hypothetical protein
MNRSFIPVAAVTILVLSGCASALHRYVPALIETTVHGTLTSVPKLVDGLCQGNASLNGEMFALRFGWQALHGIAKRRDVDVPADPCKLLGPGLWLEAHGTSNAEGDFVATDIDVKRGKDAALNGKAGD